MHDAFTLGDAEVHALGDGAVVVRDGVLAEDTVRAWAHALDRLATDGVLTPAGMGRDRVHDPSQRGDHTAWASEVDAPGLADVRPFFERVQAGLNAGAWLGLTDFEVQLARYPGDGARYARHRDALRRDPKRRATAILWLNPDWTPDHGGCLRVWEPCGPRDLEPLGGRLAVFLSDRVEHEVLPCHASRRAVTGWFRGPDARAAPVLQREADAAYPRSG